VEVQELEWQFDVDDLQPVRRRLADANTANGVFTVTSAGSITHVDVYLDTEDQRFARAGYALRLRRIGDRPGADATLKELDGGAGAETGLRSRRELSEHLDDADPQLIAGAGGPVASRVRAVAGTGPLQALFEVHTNRELLTLEADGVAPGEIALDDTTISTAGGRPPCRLQRVEIEIAAGTQDVFAPFVDALRNDCPLRPAVVSKYEAGLASAGLSLPARRSSTPT
jgi:triphosphatase